MANNCFSESVIATAMDHLVTAVGTLVDYTKVATADYDPETGTAVVTETKYLNVPAINMGEMDRQQGGLLDTDYPTGMVQMSATSIPFIPTQGDLIEIPAASITNVNRRIGRVSFVSPIFVGATPIQYSITWRLA